MKKHDAETGRSGRSNSQAMPAPPANLAPRQPHRVAFGRLVMYTVLALAGLATGLLLYVFLLLGQPQRTKIEVVDPAQMELVPLDELALPEGADILPWQDGGHTPVVVHPDIPIRRVERIDRDVENILVFGIDARGAEETVARADSLIILTLNRSLGQIQLTSVMRDTQVDIAGRSRPDRINAAYAYGGVGLLINTLNETLQLDIQRFVMFDFWSAADLIDSIGGVTISVSAEEIPFLNRNLSEMNRLLSPISRSPEVSDAGEQRLNGHQAIAWARIRKLDSDAVRTSRQRQVMMSMIRELSDRNSSGLLSLLNNGMTSFETNLSRYDMARTGLAVLPLADQISDYRIPQEGLYTVQPAPWMMQVDWDQQRPLLHAFIYGEVDGED